MSEKFIQDVLPKIQLPSRYLGNEINSIKKKWDKTDLHFALAFPDLYEIASSHFGIQILYDILNKREDIIAERVFAPAMDMEEKLRNNNFPLFSLESKNFIKSFDIIGFSLLYEMNYTNMVNMLDLAGIPFFSKDRKEDDPIIIAGGPCTCNPEPIADFFEAIVIGDGEKVIIEMIDVWKKWNKSEDRQRKNLLYLWSKIKGVYIPSLFDVRYNDKKEQILIPKTSWHHYIEKAVISDLDETDYPTKPIVPFGKPIHDRLRIEIARGCTRGCRFCQAGMIYRPVRERNPEKILSIINKSLNQTGYEDISLLSLSTGDYSCISWLMKKIMESSEKESVAISLPSLRAGTVSEEMMDYIKKVRKTGFTIAPEAGSQRLRNIINKNINEDDIFETINNAFSLGWKVIKLYFMIGLPTEVDQDLKDIVELIKKIKNKIKNKKYLKLNVSFSTFVPKPHTPFQWEKQIDIETAKNKIDWLKQKLNLPGIVVKWQDPKVSKIEGIFARGDRRLGEILIDAQKAGCRFDGWSDFFNYDKWLSVFKLRSFEFNNFNDFEIDIDKNLPWDHINIGVKKEYLLKERKMAISGRSTFDCRNGECNACGVCDFRLIKPIFHQKCSSPNNLGKNNISSLKINYSIFKYKIKFKKISNARFLAHLEMVNVFIRSFRRLKFPIRYSEGFHPMPKISFADTLPMGIQSETEEMMIEMTKYVEPKEILNEMNLILPNGIEFVECTLEKNKPKDDLHKNKCYHIQLKDKFFDKNKLSWFESQTDLNIEKHTKKNKLIQINLKDLVQKIDIIDSKTIKIKIQSKDNYIIRPAIILENIFGLNSQDIMKSIITKVDYV